MFRLIRFSLSALSIGLLVVACNAAPITPTPIGSTPRFAPTDLPAPIETPTATPAPNTAITLTLWLPPAFTPGEASPAQKILAQQLQSIGTPVQVFAKKEHGAGGLLDLLAAASPIAPSILPDVIALDTTDLEAAARSGLIQSIDNLIPTDLAADLYPFAQNLGSIDGKLYGLIYSADLEHVVFISSTLKSPPAKWSDLSALRYVFALHDGDNSVSDAVLAQYLAAGGILSDADQKPALDQAALTQLLGLYDQAQRNNLLAVNALDLNTDADAWTAWLGNNAALVNVNASLYLSVAQSLPNLKFAALPAIDQPAPPIARGWALAIVAREPRRQIAAMKFILALLSADRNGTFTQAAKVLPGRISALQQWDQNDPYTQFIGDQLQRAIAAPSTSILNIVGPALRTAIDDVLSGRATPEAAAQAAVNAVNQNK
jgi:ABC-type glycerol-3-phosphate transport system substrate-binding protein